MKRIERDKAGALVMVAHFLAAGGPASSKLVKTICEAHGMSPDVVASKVREHGATVFLDRLRASGLLLDRVSTKSFTPPKTRDADQAIG